MELQKLSQRDKKHERVYEMQRLEREGLTCLTGIPEEKTRKNVAEALCETWIRIFQN